MTLPVEKYEKLKKEAEGDGAKKISERSLESFLEEADGDREKAWEQYNFFVNRVVRINSGQSIDSKVADQVIGDIKLLDSLDSTKPIRLEFFSPGGIVYQAMRIYNAMMDAKSPIHGYCEGMIASAAFYLYVATDKRIAGQACRGMFHDVSSGDRGKTTERVDALVNSLGLEKELYETIAGNTGLPIEYLLEMGQKDVFFSVDELVKLGVVDEITGTKPRELVASSRKVPEGLTAREMARRMMEYKIGWPSSASAPALGLGK